jgi:hypothetical protein
MRIGRAHTQHHDHTRMYQHTRIQRQQDLLEQLDRKQEEMRELYGQVWRHDSY